MPPPRAPRRARATPAAPPRFELTEDVNDAGQIVGWAEVGGAVRPFLLDLAGG